MLHPDAQVSTPLGGAMSVDAWLDVNRSFAAAFPDGRHTITDVVEDGDRAAIGRELDDVITRIWEDQT